MQEAATIALALLTAHVLGDFLFQSDRVVRGKSSNAWRIRFAAHLEHGTIHYLLATLLVYLATPIPILSLRVQIILLSLVLLHFAIDTLKVGAVARERLRDGAGVFLIDQILHLLILGLVALTLAGQTAAGLPILLGLLRSNARALLAIAAIYTGILFGGGELICYLLEPFAKALPDQAGSGGESEAQGLEKAGRYIGWLERFLVMTAILIDSAAAVGLIIAAKSVFRFPEIKGRPFAEYFLIGTLLSVALAVLGGLLLKGLLSL